MTIYWRPSGISILLYLEREIHLIKLFPFLLQILLCPVNQNQSIICIKRIWVTVISSVRHTALTKLNWIKSLINQTKSVQIKLAATVSQWFWFGLGWLTDSWFLQSHVKNVNIFCTQILSTTQDYMSSGQTYFYYSYWEWWIDDRLRMLNLTSSLLIKVLHNLWKKRRTGCGRFCNRHAALQMKGSVISHKEPPHCNWLFNQPHW